MSFHAHERFDPRTTLAHGDRASTALEGRLEALRYIEPVALQVCAPVAPMRKAAARVAEQVDQLLFGERFDVLEEADGFAFGQARRDGYVGWVERAHLGESAAAATHRVGVLRAYAFAEPAIRAAPTGPFSLNALVAIDEAVEGFLHAPGAGWFASRVLAPIGAAFETDWADVAARFVGTPYLWGGRDSVGLDCSALVQQALYACGRACARDSDQQRELGRSVRTEPAQRGDLVFWRGHVGVMLDDAQFVHANAHHMAVAIEPLDEAIARIAVAGGGDLLDRRRLA